MLFRRAIKLFEEFSSIGNNVLLALEDILKLHLVTFIQIQIFIRKKTNYYNF